MQWLFSALKLIHRVSALSYKKNHMLYTHGASCNGKENSSFFQRQSEVVCLDLKSKQAIYGEFIRGSSSFTSHPGRLKNKIEKACIGDVFTEHVCFLLVLVLELSDQKRWSNFVTFERAFIHVSHTNYNT